MSTHLEVLAESFVAHCTLQLGARPLAAAGQRPLWYRVTGGCLVVVTQQFVLAAKLQLTHVAGEELQPNVGEGVGDTGGAVWERGSTQSAEPQLRQVSLSVSSDGGRVCWQRHRAGFT